MDSDSLEQALLNSEWEEYDHPDIIPIAKGYRAKLPGRFGLIPIANLSHDAKIILRDPKGTGKVEATVHLPKAEAEKIMEKVEHTTALIGPYKEEASVLWTFFPGDPIMPSSVSAEDYHDGTEITKEEALELGLKYAKLA